MPRSVQFVDDDRDGAVARNVCGGAEAVHGYVESNHQADHCFVEAEHCLQDADGGHYCATRDSRCGDHGDAEHHDEADIG